MNHTCIGFLELSSIAHGIKVTDALLKKAKVTIVFAQPVSAGKFLVCFAGEVEDVRSAFSAGQEIAQESLLDKFILTQIHPEIIPGLDTTVVPETLDAIGILELATCAGCIVAADSALKTSKVRLLKMQLAKGIGGKAYFIIEGEVGEVESAMFAAVRTQDKHNIIAQVVISQATSDLLTIFR